MLYFRYCVLCYKAWNVIYCISNTSAVIWFLLLAFSVLELHILILNQIKMYNRGCYGPKFIVFQNFRNLCYPMVYNIFIVHHLKANLLRTCHLKHGLEATVRCNPSESLYNTASYELFNLQNMMCGFVMYA